MRLYSIQMQKPLLLAYLCLKSRDLWSFAIRTPVPSGDTHSIYRAGMRYPIHATSGGSRPRVEPFMRVPANRVPPMACVSKRRAPPSFVPSSHASHDESQSTAQPTYYPAPLSVAQHHPRRESRWLVMTPQVKSCVMRIARPTFPNLFLASRFR